MLVRTACKKVSVEEQLLKILTDNYMNQPQILMHSICISAFDGCCIIHVGDKIIVPEAVVVDSECPLR